MSNALDSIRQLDPLVRRRAELEIIYNQVIKLENLFNGGTLVEFSDNLETLKKDIQRMLSESA